MNSNTDRVIMFAHNYGVPLIDSAPSGGVRAREAGLKRIGRFSTEGGKGVVDEHCKDRAEKKKRFASSIRRSLDFASQKKVYNKIEMNAKRSRTFDANQN